MERTLLVHLFEKVGNDSKLSCEKYIELYFSDDNELKKTIELLGDEQTLMTVLCMERLPGPEEPLGNIYFSIRKIIDSFEDCSRDFVVISDCEFRVMEIIEPNIFK